jgi:hypothetical protein
MAIRPGGVTDLYLAPVALQVDAILEEAAGKSADELTLWLAWSTDAEPRSIEDRRKLAVRALRRDVDLHGWRLKLVDRGLRLKHKDTSIVLGVPATLMAYLTGGTGKP